MKTIDYLIYKFNEAETGLKLIYGIIAFMVLMLTCNGIYTLVTWIFQ